jgi:hypothetical protein
METTTRIPTVRLGMPGKGNGKRNAISKANLMIDVLIAVREDIGQTIAQRDGAR